MMGISLVAMTVFLYPSLEKIAKNWRWDGPFPRGTGGTWYFLLALGFLAQVRVWQRIHCHRG